jgi:hypothetical protein
VSRDEGYEIKLRHHAIIVKPHPEGGLCPECRMPPESVLRAGGVLAFWQCRNNHMWQVVREDEP